MKKVLMISYFYPPLGGVGIIRTLKFTKYLPKFGWMPYVLTVKNRDRFYTSISSDEIPDHVKVYRSWNVFNNLSIFEGGLRRLGVKSQILVPDAYIGWVPLTVRRAEKIIKEDNIDLIYVSCPPHSQSLIGAKLKSMTGIPLVVDFRDAWTLNPYSSGYLLKSLKNLNERLERYVFESADYIVTTSNGTKEDYILKYPFVESKISTIYNGFDLDDFTEDKTSNSFNKFTIVYTGYLYGLRTPELLFSAFKKILKNNLIPKNKFQFIWVGRDAPFVHNLIDRYNVQNIVKYEGFVSQKGAVEYLYKSHLLFLLSAPMDKRSIAAKTFEYIASGKPILSLTPNKETEELIKKYSGNPYMITSQNVDEVVDAVINAYNKWRNGKSEDKTSIKREEFRCQFNREALTRNMVEIFEEIIR